MEKIICCMYDKKSQVYDGFMLFDNTAQAVRAFRMSCEKNEILNKWPEDFRFIQIGTIDQKKGTVKENIQILGEAIHFVDTSKKNEENNK